MVVERAAKPAALADSPASYGNPSWNGNGNDNNPSWGNGNGDGNGNGGEFGGPLFQCQGLLQTPQCCETDVLDLASLTCKAPDYDSFTKAGFRAECAKTGTTAQCCVLPIVSLSFPP